VYRYDDLEEQVKGLYELFGRYSCLGESSNSISSIYSNLGSGLSSLTIVGWK